MTVYFGTRWNTLSRRLEPWLAGAIGVGLFVVVMAHETNLLGRMVHRTLPANVDVLARVRGWSHLGELVGNARTQLESEGKPVFVIGEHYGIVSLVSFYNPEAKAHSQPGQVPFVYMLTADQPESQFYFWPGYTNRIGENAIFMRKIDRPKLAKGWLGKWLDNETNLWRPDTEPLMGPPAKLLSQFESVTNLGVQNILYQYRVMRRVQLFECRNLKAP